uniref:Mannosyltransferase n=1 Tax=Anas platyrhynchos platyrhynchos TaxID=8840 RepID=A0A493TBF5_ANAPP
MPAGVPWPTYLKTLAASLLAMLAGAEVVHRYYGPDLVTLLSSATECLAWGHSFYLAYPPIFVSTPEFPKLYLSHSLPLPWGQ